MVSEILYLRLKAIYFNEIKRGLKHEEYRLVCKYWDTRLKDRTYKWIHITKGYPSRIKISRENCLRFPWKGYTIKKITHQLWGNQEKEVYAIKLERD